jgi:hypothetical protein
MGRAAAGRRYLILLVCVWCARRAVDEDKFNAHSIFLLK